MNNELEENLKEIFLQWRKEMMHTEDCLFKGVITFVESVRQQNDQIETASRRMFDAVHSLADW